MHHLHLMRRHSTRHSAWGLFCIGQPTGPAVRAAPATDRLRPGPNISGLNFPPGPRSLANKPLHFQRSVSLMDTLTFGVLRRLTSCHPVGDAFADHDGGGVGIGASTWGMMEESATHRPSTPRTRHCWSVTAMASPSEPNAPACCAVDAVGTAIYHFRNRD